MESINIVSYLVLQTSFVTAEQLKAQKGLEANNQFLYSWVKDVCNQKVAGKCVVTGQVTTSSHRFSVPKACMIQM